MPITLEDAGIRRALDAIDLGTQRLVDSVRRQSPDALRAPSGLPTWTRGHVITHVARNAEALVNLVMYAADGRPRAMYPSMDARNEGIESGAERPGPELLADLTATADRFLWAARELSRDRWGNEVTLITGRRVPAYWVLGARMREVEFHHVDLSTGYFPDRWSPAFVGPCLDEISKSMSGRPEMPALKLQSTDQLDPNSWTVVGRGDPITVFGPPASLLAWLTGRSSGDDLSHTAEELPPIPPWA
ncbi:MAG: maleylpyruvate isomerase family mycothiol-dependent enzyme [Sporichthyaceae bacterium]